MNCGYSMFRTINYRTLFLTRTVKILPISTCNEFSNRRREWSSRLIGPETRMRGRRSASAVEVQGDCQHHAGVLIDFVLATGGEKRGLSGGGKGHGSGERGEERPVPSRWAEFVQSRATLRIFLRLAPPSPSLRRCGLHLRLRRTPRLPHLRLFRASADAFRIRVGGARNPETRDHEVSADSTVWTALDESTSTVLGDLTLIQTVHFVGIFMILFFF